MVKVVTDKTIDLDEHIRYFLSKDKKDLDNYENDKAAVFGNQARFICGRQHLPISYTSYPRSGNTFLRKYLENITGIATGSDQFMKFTMNVCL